MRGDEPPKPDDDDDDDDIDDSDDREEYNDNGDDDDKNQTQLPDPTGLHQEAPTPPPMIYTVSQGNHCLFQ